MSLVAWYPLNGDFKNYGIGDGLDLTNSGGVPFANGKIGKCASFDGSAKELTNASTTFNYKGKFSFCCWIKHTGDSTTRYAFTVGRVDTGSYGYGIGVDSSNRVIIRYGSNGRTFDVAEVPANEWHHIACVILTNSTGYVYVDGEPSGNFISLSTPTYTESCGIGIGCFRYLTSSTPTSIYRFKGCINDLRIYDHPLSPKEVKEISKGLVMHLPMNNVDGYIGGRNLLTGTYNHPSSMNDYTSKATLTRNNDSSTVSGKNFAIAFPADSATYSNYNTYIGLTRNTTLAPQADGRTYTLSFLVKASKNISAYTFNYEYFSSKQISVNITTTWQKVVLTGISGGNYSAMYVCIGEANRKKINGSTLYLADIKLELGGVATTWTPSPEDLTILKDNTVYDVSGYGNNGTVTDASCPVWTDNRVKGYGSFNFGGTKYVQTSYTNNMDQLSCTFWIMPNASSGGYAIIASNYNKPDGGFWIGSNTENSGLWFYTGSYVKYTTLLANDQWSFGCFTFNKGVGKLYVNGVLKATSTLTKTTLPISNLTIGNSYTGTAWNTKQFGNIQDFRLYATALSDADIADLYKARASVTNKGTVFCDNYIENSFASSVNFDSFGGLTTLEAYQKMDLLDMPTKTLSDGSVWARIFYHNNRAGTKYFSSTHVSSATNFSNSPIIVDSDRYSRLNLVEFFRCNGVYEFMACQPDDGNGTWRWTQTNNPVTSTSAGTVKQISGTTTWTRGLMKCSGSTFLAHSATNSDWWCGVGTYSAYNGGLPGFGGVIVKGGLELWIRIFSYDKLQIYKNTISCNDIIEW